ncbi:p074 [Rhizobium phage 16-3]|uniref:p074 n=1 Tax=Rhizobium phage 16-3 TaxID=10704 RepID=UPI00017BA61B|nr:p074 [Rhizobium phage 16-3]ABF71328.1 p074 [Rhizobium phage 16-3]
MGKFKVGDRVRATVDSAYSVRKGDIYTVTEILDERTIRFRKSDGTIDGWDSNNFELVEQPWRPKVGDRVRFTDECKEYWWFGPHTENKEGVVSLDRGADYDFDDGRFEVRTSDSFGIVGLKHIEPLPVAAEAQPALQVIEGKFYKTRDGRKVGPIRQRGDYYIADGWHYNESGECCYLGESGKDVHPDHDIIAEWVDEPAVPSDTVAVAATASNDNEPKSTTGFTIPLVDEEPANDNQVVVTLSLDADAFHEELDEIIAKLKKIRKLQRQTGLAA